MDLDKLHRAQGKRLAAVRKAAGYRSAREAAMECGWPESTYRAHENGSRTIKQPEALKYVNRFKSEGAKGYTAQWVMFGDDRNLNDLVEGLPPDALERVYEAVLAEVEKLN
jgi:hypothetical protein